jgi:hypothetical protein
MCGSNVQSSTKAENTAVLMERMKISERDFIVKHWQPKENRFGFYQILAESWL